jgi:hypothetical protein
MSLYRAIALPAILMVSAACSEATRLSAPKLSPGLRVADCDGPATSLDPAIAATLRAREGTRTPDDRWADLARQAPGGFAGVLYDEGKPVLLLKDVSQAQAAKQALAPSFPNFDIAGAQVREARWDFAQLVDWHNYLMQQYRTWVTPGFTSSDNDEAVNRVAFGAADGAARLEMARNLSGMNLPCDLIVLEIRAPAQIAPLLP